jgi:transposase InsO family protein
MSAMAVMSRCRQENLGVTVQDIITSKSISHLASLVTLPEELSYQDEDDQEFDLSPIQQVYFQCMQGKQTHFNQSMLLHLTRVVDTEDVRRALDELVKRHSMLRARFSQDEAGVWRQRITLDTQESYHFRVYKAEEIADIQNLIEDTQKSIDIVDGPVLAVSVFKSGSEDNQLFISAHHLVIDVVSWSVILQDLEDLLHSKAIMKSTPLSFQTWCHLQVENAQRVTSRRVLPVEEVPTADFSYWGMEGRPNTYGNTVTVETEIEDGISRELFGTCHAALQTEFVDIMMAALLMSFSRVFVDREMPPAIYNEAHGREPWDPSIDLSGTVGWFTTLTPVHFPTDHIVHGGKNDPLRPSIFYIVTSFVE